jgi:hypothetical protein
MGRRGRTGEPARRDAGDFTFTVRDEAVAHCIQEVMGRRVSVTYQQHIGIPSSCFGETGYFITDIRSVE